MGVQVQLDRQRNFKLTSPEDEVLESLAQQRGMTVSQLIRFTLRNALFLPLNGSQSPIQGVERTDEPAVTEASGA